MSPSITLIVHPSLSDVRPWINQCPLHRTSSPLKIDFGLSSTDVCKVISHSLTDIRLVCLNIWSMYDRCNRHRTDYLRCYHRPPAMTQWPWVWTAGSLKEPESTLQVHRIPNRRTVWMEVRIIWPMIDYMLYWIELYALSALFQPRFPILDGECDWGLNIEKK